ncbi:prepilin-type N-terminal cleavage/methylation domain-containing protein [Anaeromicropila populeti]|nr:prepilin-type N-terminal cleavage/methylation domain-containing protein [Anaeromicropila populeti]
MREELRKSKKLGNKGFSLIEMIIVIAIMAILVGVVGTAVLPYMEKSRKAKDMQIVSGISTSALAVFAEHADVISTDEHIVTNSTGDTGNSTILAGLKELLGVPATSTSIFDDYLPAGTFQSKDGKSATSLHIDYVYATGKVTVQLYNGTTALLDPAVSK